MSLGQNEWTVDCNAAVGMTSAQHGSFLYSSHQSTRAFSNTDCALLFSLSNVIQPKAPHPNKLAQ